MTTTTGLTLAGGTLTLSGATASYSGATTIDSGADLTLTGPTSIASSSGVTNNGTFDISGNGATTIATLSGTSSSANVALGGNTLTIAGGSAANPYDGSFTGSGGLTIAGGALALFGASPSYSGTTTIDSGATLQVGANGALGTGALTFASGSILQETLQAGANNLSFSNSVTLNNPTDSFDTHGNTLTWTGAITGSGNLNVADSVGGGTVILSNVGNSYSGATTVNSGTLSVIGSIASSSGVTVNGGTLSGIGTVSGVTVNNGGTLSPGSSGNPIGTLTITGNPANTNLTMATGANYVATITGSNDADTSLTSVTGKASLAGTLTLAGTGGSTSATYEILSATGVISGTFSGINITGSFGNDLPTLNYGVSTEVQLTLTAGTVWSGATSSDWLGAGNWQGGIPPNSATAVAAFDDTATNKSVIISSADGSVTVGTMLFNANAPAYTITVNSGGTLTLATNGVVNESTTTTPTFNVAGSLLFSGNSTAANSQLNVLSGGVVNFSGSLGPSGNGLLSVGSISNGTSVTGGSILLGSNTLSVGSNNLSTSFNGTISGIGGSLNKVGTGTQTLGGNNTYSGGTTITAGTLQAGSNTAVGTSTVTLSGGTFQAGANNLSLGNNFSLSNTLSNAIDTFGKTLTLAGTITGTGPLIVESSTGSGTLTLTGANNYSGVTNVNFGTLQLDSGGSLTSSSDVNVNAGGIFAGIGNVTVPLLNIIAGGTLAPGSTSTPNGTLTIHGSLTLSSAALYMVTINGPNSSFANVTGTATLGGAGLVASITSTNISLTQAYKVLTAGTVSGTFTTPVFNVPGVGLLQAIDVTSAGGTVTAQFQRAQLNASSLPSGFASFVNAINAASGNNTLSPQFLDLFNLPAGSQQIAALQLSGVGNSGGSAAAAAMQTSFATTALHHQPDLGASSGGFGTFGPVLGFAPDTPLTPQQQQAYDAVTPHDAVDALMRSLNPEYNHSVWASAYGGYSQMTGSSNIGSPTARIGGGGLASGIDFRFGSGSVLGFAMGGGDTGWNVSNGLGGGNSKIFQAGIYGSQPLGDRAYVSGALAVMYDWMSINRYVTLPSAANLTASLSAPGATARIETGYRFGVKDFNVTPYIAGEFSALRLPAYTESGNSAFALSYAAETPLNERAELGVWAGKRFQLQDTSTLLVRGRVGYAHDWWSDSSFNANFVSLPTQSFTMTGLTPPADVGLASLMGQISYLNGMSFALQLDTEVGSSYYSLAGTGTFRYAW